MFLNFYHLRAQPFQCSPDPHFLYLGPSHAEALASLYCGIEANCALLALIASPGLGKTTLLNRLLKHYSDSARTIFLFNMPHDSWSFLRHLLLELGIDFPADDFAMAREKLKSTLLAELASGRRILLVIDEAHNLNESVLESIRLLSNFETHHSNHLQIILAGHAQLAETLAQPALSHLRQRISIIARLRPFTAEEAACYIEHRLALAGYTGRPLFSPGAVDLLFRHSQGVPLLINNLCFSALLLGCALQRRTIDEQLLSEVLSDHQLDSLLESPASASASLPRAIDSSSKSFLSKKLRVVVRRNLFRRAVACITLLLVVLVTSLLWAMTGRSLASGRDHSGPNPQDLAPDAVPVAVSLPVARAVP